MSKVQELILRREKHEDTLAKPLPARIGVPRTEPLTVAAAIQYQQQQVAARSGYRLVHDNHIRKAAELFLSKLLPKQSGRIGRRFAVMPANTLSKDIRRGSFGIGGELIATNDDKVVGLAFRDLEPGLGHDILGPVRHSPTFGLQRADEHAGVTTIRGDGPDNLHRLADNPLQNGNDLRLGLLISGETNDRLSQRDALSFELGEKAHRQLYNRLKHTDNRIELLFLGSHASLPYFGSPLTFTTMVQAPGSPVKELTLTILNCTPF